MEKDVMLAGWKRRETWIRGLFMLLFMAGFGLGQAGLNLIAVVQFLWLVIAGEPNRFLAGFGGSLAVWLFDAARFLSAATDEKPFPWKPWPAVQ
jgi:hypothetical protein